MRDVHVVSQTLQMKCERDQVSELYSFIRDKNSIYINNGQFRRCYRLIPSCIDKVVSKLGIIGTLSGATLTINQSGFLDIVGTWKETQEAIWLCNEASITSIKEICS